MITKKGTKSTKIDRIGFQYFVSFVIFVVRSE
jgi:hypothetical protein